ncbi:MAG: alpha/beta hydrolase [Burkholderiales bacterium]|nr:alpha/beta hydrolase [Burkholderiales bacterium]
MRRLARILPLLVALAAAPQAARAVDEVLLPALREEIVPVRKTSTFGVELQTTYFRPAGDGPFPWVVINHGKASGDPRFQARARYLLVARELVQRGWAVVVPMRQGFGKSGGVYLDAGCNVHSNGLAQADDVREVIAAYARRPELDPQRVMVWGQSHGGWTTLATGSLGLSGVRGLVSFAGGLKQSSCLNWEGELAAAVGRYGAATAVPALFFYGDNDSFWPEPLWRDMVQRYNAAGGKARVVAYGSFGKDAHDMFGSSAGLPIWLPEVERFVRELGLPFDKRQTIALFQHAVPPPPASGFAPVADVAAVPLLREAGRVGYAKYLDGTPPKAFAIGPQGQWFWRSDRAEAMTQALAECQRLSKDQPCRLYAVDDQVVWTKD